MVGGSDWVKIAKKDYQLRSIKRSIYNLRRQKFIVTKKIGQKLFISLTQKGQLATLTQELRESPKLKNGFSTVIIFDIPETERRSRRILRRWLKIAGFSLIQKSVWFTDKDNAHKLKKVLNQLGLDRWINVFLAKIIN